MGARWRQRAAGVKSPRGGLPPMPRGSPRNPLAIGARGAQNTASFSCRSQSIPCVAGLAGGAPDAEVPRAVNFLFISPHFPPEMENFTQGLAAVGVNLYAIADVPEAQLPAHVRHCLSGFLHVPAMLDEKLAVEAVTEWTKAKGLRFDKIESLWEPFVLLAARLRETFGVPGMSYEKVLAFRDKDIMKKKVREAGLRVPKSTRVRSAKDIYAAAEEIGFPIIIKPIAGAGSADTYRLDDNGMIDRVLPLIGHLTEGNVEEFIEGDEFTFDSVTLNGKPEFHSVTEYHPRPLDGRTHEWISPAQLTFRDLAQPRLAKGIELGMNVLKAMEMETGFTHMEWFLTPKGEAVFGEIGCRSGGGNLVDMMNFSNDFNIYREWANVVAHGKWEAPIERKYNVAMAFKRAQGQGRIQRIDGLDRVRARCGKWIVWENLLPIGAPRRDWTQTLVSDGFIVVRHPDEKECYEMMWSLINDLKMYAG